MLYNFTHDPNGMSKNKTKLGSPNMIRFDQTTKQDLERVAERNGLSVSAIVRIAVANQLPKLKTGRTALKSS